MTKRTPVIDWSGNTPEILEELGKTLGKAKLRRRVFNVIYGRGLKPRSKKQIMQTGKIPAAQAQQVQNELNYLATNGLIISARLDRKGADGSAVLYERDAIIRGKRAKIIRYADNPSAAKRLATKRRPQVSATINVRQVSQRTLSRKKPVTVLYMVADPSKTLRVDLEMARVQDEIRGSRYRKNVKIEYVPAANLNALVRGLNDHEPQIVHFSGHGDTKGLATDKRKLFTTKAADLPFELFANALETVDNPPRIVVLNSCGSSGAKKLILPHVQALITMKVPISDDAAMIFAAQFYAAIASGQSLKSAFGQGRNAIEAAFISERDTPELHLHVVDAGNMKLA